MSSSESSSSPPQAQPLVSIGHDTASLVMEHAPFKPEAVVQVRRAAPTHKIKFGKSGHTTASKCALTTTTHHACFSCRHQGAVTTACVDLGDTATLKCGVWEHNVGVSIQENDDEVFVVLSGTGVIRFDDGTPDLVLAPGVVGRLLAGKNRRWEVTSAFRKIWIVERGANCL